MTISIHQPNFFPHEPFFEKMKRADRFVLLTHCQFEKNNYQNRFRMYDHWHTMRVAHGMKPIRDKKYIDPQKDWAFIKHHLPKFDLSKFDYCINEGLSVTNAAIIYTIAKLLGITTEIATDLPTELKGTARLVDICKQHGADTYLSGPSGESYMDLKLFDEAGIKVVFQEKLASRPIIEALHAKGLV